MATKCIKVYGIVQGVGFRPTVARHAASLNIKGSVCNYGPYVEIIAEGEEGLVSEFIDLIRVKPPKRAVILKMDVRDIADGAYDSFEIIPSGKTRGEIFVSPDIAVCDECLSELFNKDDRRYLHPFINCTCCGPRLTILESLPYDRERTSMKEFEMCPECASEYHSPSTRRYDAQPVCCNNCGPEVFILDDKQNRRSGEAITYTRKVIAEGGIAAVKGIGGFHLACDATNDAAVMRLRELKSRPVKPFAVMMRDRAEVLRNCYIEPYQEDILTGHQKPIILLTRREDSVLSSGIAPGNPKVGVMLPYAPVQSLLFDYDDGINMPRSLVMTSGNLSGLPICRNDEDARREIASYCDVILTHNRKIRTRADDSVMDFYNGRPYMIRRSRGYAPLPFMVSDKFEGQVTAYGGELKNTFCIASGNLMYPSAYIGDLTDLKGKEALKETIGRMETLLETVPKAAVCDMHPSYNSSMLARERGIPVIEVQHHYAHILSCMAENDYGKEVIGIALDGTGYGTDGSIWGGEILRCDLNGFERLAHIRPFLHTGGDIASKEGYRIAISMLIDIYKDMAEEVTDSLGLIRQGSYKMFKAMHDGRINTAVSTSCGRLFDSVSAILGIRYKSTFEGEAATALQYAAMEYTGDKDIKVPDLTDGDVIATDRIVKAMAEGRMAGEDINKLAYMFHLYLASGVAEMACLKSGDIRVIALSGGCYQNTLLVSLTEKILTDKGYRVLLHSMVPPNDGGIALGQAYYGMNKINKEAR